MDRRAEYRGGGVTAINVQRYRYLLDFYAGDAGGYNPADATTYYFGSFIASDPSAIDNDTLTIPVFEDGTIIGAVVNVDVVGVLGSGESATVFVRKNSTTNIGNLSTAVLHNALATKVIVTGLALAVVSGDRLKIGITTPTFATNPTVVFYRVTLVFQPTNP